MLHSLRQGGLKGKPYPGEGLFQLQSCRVEGGAGDEGRGLGAVEEIPRQGVARGGELGADLMGFSRDQFHFYLCKTEGTGIRRNIKVSQWAIGSADIFSRWLAAYRYPICPGIFLQISPNFRGSTGNVGSQPSHT